MMFMGDVVHWRIYVLGIVLELVHLHDLTWELDVCMIKRLHMCPFTNVDNNSLCAAEGAATILIYL